MTRAYLILFISDKLVYNDRLKYESIKELFFMNYGKRETERRLKSLHSKSAKYTSKLFLNIFKALFVLFLFCMVVGASIGFGMVKGTLTTRRASTC